MTKEKRKTREMVSKEEWSSPIHKLTVEHRVRTVTTKDNKRKFGGSYYACPEYHECKYYVTQDGIVPIL